MKRWTIEELSSMDSIDFAVAVLNERRAKISPYSPLAQKCQVAEKELEALKAKIQKSNKAEVHMEKISNDKFLCNVNDTIDNAVYALIAALVKGQEDASEEAADAIAVLCADPGQYTALPSEKQKEICEAVVKKAQKDLDDLSAENEIELDEDGEPKWNMYYIDDVTFAIKRLLSKQFGLNICHPWQDDREIICYAGCERCAFCPHNMAKAMTADTLIAEIADAFGLGDIDTTDGKVKYTDDATGEPCIYDSKAAFLEDWVDTLIEQQECTQERCEDVVHEEGAWFWDAEVEAIYGILGKLPKGIRKVENQAGTGSVYIASVELPGKSGKSEDIGKFLTIARAIIAQRGFARLTKDITDMTEIEDVLKDYQTSFGMA